MKQKALNIGCSTVLVGILAGCVTFIVYMLTRWAKGIWQFISEPGLSRELMATVGYLGLCFVGIVILIIIVGNIPHKWWHGGLESSSDDDDPYYRYM
ncbi:MAG TPA: hypothetical protein VFQ13_18375 [Anaerolineales bacterium]|nr:hypothetical protein [Anaerolineales bacterium]